MATRSSSGSDQGSRFHGERGGHRCPGEDVVTVAVKLYLTLLLRRATWDLPEQDLELTNELFPLPTSGLRVTFHPESARSLTAPDAGNLTAG